MPARDPAKPDPIFLNSREARARLRFALRLSGLLWVGAGLSWLTQGDTALFLRVETHRTLQALRPLGEWYSFWGLYMFYLPFLASLALGIAKKITPISMVGLAYLRAQLFGTVLLVHLIKLWVDRPRPHTGAVEAAGFQLAHFGHTLHTSFPSSHAVDVAVGAMFAGVLLRSRAASITALAGALLMAASRILIGKHYLSDVLAGLALGIGVAGVVMHLYLLPRWQDV